MTTPRDLFGRASSKGPHSKLGRKPVTILGWVAVASCVAALGWVTPVEAQPVRLLDLATVSPSDGIAEWVWGATGQGDYGVPVAAGFDVDGDGFEDVAVGYMTSDPLGRTDAGEVDLVFGDGAVSGGIDTASDDARVLRIYGAAQRETAGSEIWMDDVTGDGLGDLLICRQNYTPSGSRIGAGALTIVVGGAALRTHAATLAPIDLAAPVPAGLTLTTLVGPQELGRFCIWARTGDVDGDGIADLAVGADQEDGDSESNRGTLYAIRGGAHLAVGGTLDLISGTTLAGLHTRITPPPGSAGYHLGATCQVADLDGNGRAEVLAAATINRAGAALPADGAPAGSADASGGAPDGAFFIAWDDNFPDNSAFRAAPVNTFGRGTIAGAAWPSSFALNATPGSVTSFHGETRNISFGEELLGGLDYDGNGTADLFVGDLVGDASSTGRIRSGIGYAIFDAASLKNRELDLDTLPADVRLSVVIGPNPEAIAADTAAHGDLDRDGIADLIIASPHGRPNGRTNAGMVHVLFGRRGGWPAEIDLAPGALPTPSEIRILEIWGAQGNAVNDTGDTLAYSAATGDVDSDGIPDFVTNEMVGNGVSPGTVDVGNLIVLGGASLGGVIFHDGFEGGGLGEWSTATPAKVPQSR